MKGGAYARRDTPFRYPAFPLSQASMKGGAYARRDRNVSRVPVSCVITRLDEGRRVRAPRCHLGTGRRAASPRASMKGGAYARRDGPGADPGQLHQASMKGGAYARRDTAPRVHAPVHAPASMKGGAYARRDSIASAATSQTCITPR